MFGEGSNKLLLPTQSTCNVLCVCGMNACYKINMFKPNVRYSLRETSELIKTYNVSLPLSGHGHDLDNQWEP